MAPHEEIEKNVIITANIYYALWAKNCSKSFTWIIAFTRQYLILGKENVPRAECVTFIISLHPSFPVPHYVWYSGSSMIWLIRCSNPRKVLRTVPGRDLARKKCELSLVPYFLLNPEEIQYFWIYTHTEACIFLASINTQCYSRQDNNAEVATALRARDLRLGVEFFRLMDWAPQQVPPLLRALISSCTHQMCEPDGLTYKSPISPLCPL